MALFIAEEEEEEEEREDDGVDAAKEGSDGQVDGSDMALRPIGERKRVQKSVFSLHAGVTKARRKATWLGTVRALFFQRSVFFFSPVVPFIFSLLCAHHASPPPAPSS